MWIEQNLWEILGPQQNVKQHQLYVMREDLLGIHVLFLQQITKDDLKENQTAFQLYLSPSVRLCTEGFVGVHPKCRPLRALIKSGTRQNALITARLVFLLPLHLCVFVVLFCRWDVGLCLLHGRHLVTARRVTKKRNKRK